MENNIFMLSDASYSSQIKKAGLGVIDTFTQKKYQLSISNIQSAYQAELYALALSVKIAIEQGYSNVVFVYDCKDLVIDGLKQYAQTKIKSVQFLWLKRDYLQEADFLAKQARTLKQLLPLKVATKNDVQIIKKETYEEEMKKVFISFSNEKKLMAVMHICNEREREILNGFLNSSSIKLSSYNALGSKKATLLKFVYAILSGSDKMSFLHYITYVKPSVDKKAFRRLKLTVVCNYINQTLSAIKKTKELKCL